MSHGFAGPGRAGTLHDVDRRLSRFSRWNRDRRLARGHALAELLHAQGEATFDELVRAGDPADTADVAMWLSYALLDGMIEEIEPGAPGEPRRFRLLQREAEQRWVRRTGDAPPRRGQPAH